MRIGVALCAATLVDALWLPRQATCSPRVLPVVLSESPLRALIDNVVAPTPEELLWQPPPTGRRRRRHVYGEEDTDVDLKELDEQVTRIVSLKATDGPAVRQFSPQSMWLWQRWRDTVLEETWLFTVCNMLFGTLFITSARLGFPLIVGASEPCSWGLFTTPLATHPLVAVLLPLNAFWSMQVTLTTFIVTFFLGKAYDFWRISYKLGRSIQGRLQDINLMLATHCFRDAQGEYTPDSRSILEDTARHVRLLHGLFWAGIDDSLSSIRTQRGLLRLRERGLMTERELFALVTSGAPPSARHNVVIGWIMARTVDARAREALEFGAGTESVFVGNILQLRAQCNSVPDETVARMPLAYVHLVQILVDSLLVTAPVALYPQVGVLSVPLSGLLTIFFRGLLNLSKAFLDPFGNAPRSKSEPRQTIMTDALMAEVNAASTRWWRGGERLPFDTIYIEPERVRHQPTTPLDVDRLSDAL